ncbi:hypothetical protein BD408DRAFT_350956 [Parasitella parasitica]|nr:hypothetical protein BD408DRAFT_350956 [Parasitella parasitica]
MDFNARQTKIANILETYFSDASLLWDKVMLSKMLKDPEKMVSFEELSKLPKFKSITAATEEIRSAAERHSTNRLKLNKDKQKVGRIKPYVVDKKEELDEWSIYVEGLKKPYDNEQSIRELFNKLVGSVSFFRIPPTQKGECRFFGYCFVEFNDKNNVDRAIQIVNRYNCSDIATDTLAYRMQWNALKDEYLILLTERKTYVTSLWNEYQKEGTEENMEQEVDEKPFLEGLIVFVDCLHPQCPKTVAIALLQTSGVQIAFMNVKKKGLTSTHIRLKTAEDAIRICDYFSTHHIIQETEKDTTGKEQGSRTTDCLRLRRIQGTEEEIYWENELNRR